MLYQSLSLQEARKSKHKGLCNFFGIKERLNLCSNLQHYQISLLGWKS
jgi:hypothetical protein